MNKNNNGFLEKFILSLTDSSIVFFGFMSAYWMLDGMSFSGEGNSIIFMLWLSLNALIPFLLFDLYNDWRRKSKQQLIYSIVLANLLYSTVLLCVSFVNLLSVSGGVIVTASIIQTLLILLTRNMIWSVFRRFYGEKKVLIIGSAEEETGALADKFLNHSKGWFVVHGFVLVQERHVITEHISDVDVLVLSSKLSQEEKVEWMNEGVRQNKEVILIPEMTDIYIYGARTEVIEDTLVFSLQPPKMSKIQQFMKRTMDIVIASFVLVMASPVIILLYVLVPLTSKGPALFIQERIGLDGIPFQIYKFRSMVQEAEKKTGPVLATEKDERITPLGRFIRSTRLDELPQLFNVLRGDMSVIGPRPERAFFIKQFQQKIPNYMLRLSVKPGITGLAQVLANYATSVEDKLRYDLMYLRHYSVLLDIKILIQTLRVIPQREQAKGVYVKHSDSVQQQLLRLTQDEVI